ncbi:MAG: U32 family peptidase C-terminal domain-containing protein, partial [Eubacteriales bacterium]|nr:U32 family peptidase C-terminal domain-containing protein [Eubacteriales bacterium]
RNKFFVGDMLDILPPSGISFEVVAKKLTNEYGEEVDSAPHAMQKLFMEVDREIPVGSVIRKKIVDIK